MWNQILKRFPFQTIWYSLNQKCVQRCNWLKSSISFFTFVSTWKTYPLVLLLLFLLCHSPESSTDPQHTFHRRQFLWLLWQWRLSHCLRCHNNVGAEQCEWGCDVCSGPVWDQDDKQCDCEEAGGQPDADKLWGHQARWDRCLNDVSSTTCIMHIVYLLV